MALLESSTYSHEPSGVTRRSEAAGPPPGKVKVVVALVAVVITVTVPPELPTNTFDESGVTARAGAFSWAGTVMAVPTAGEPVKDVIG